MRAKQLSTFVVAATICVGLLSISASASCEQPDRECRDRIGSAASGMDHGEGVRSAVDRAKDVGGAAVDCVQCAYDNFKNSLDKMTVDPFQDDQKK